MSEAQQAESDVTSEREQETDDTANDEVDLQALAEKVYQLLKEEARIERERLGRRRS